MLYLIENYAYQTLYLKREKSIFYIFKFRKKIRYISIATKENKTNKKMIFIPDVKININQLKKLKESAQYQLNS